MRLGCHSRQRLCSLVHDTHSGGAGSEKKELMEKGPKKEIKIGSSMRALLR
jgi:hypothetical protein